MFWLQQFASGGLRVRVACPLLLVYFGLKTQMFDGGGCPSHELGYEVGACWHGLPSEESGLMYARSWKIEFFRFMPELHSSPAPR